MTNRWAMDRQDLYCGQLERSYNNINCNTNTGNQTQYDKKNKFYTYKTNVFKRNVNICIHNMKCFISIFQVNAHYP